MSGEKRIGHCIICHADGVELFPDYENDPLGQKYADIIYGVAHERADARR